MEGEKMNDSKLMNGRVGGKGWGLSEATIILMDDSTDSHINIGTNMNLITICLFMNSHTNIVISMNLTTSILPFSLNAY